MEYRVDSNGEIGNINHHKKWWHNYEYQQDKEEYNEEDVEYDETEEEDDGEEFHNFGGDDNIDNNNNDDYFEENYLLSGTLRTGDNFDWKSQGTIRDFWYNLGCTEWFNNERPIYPQSTWEEARAVYKTLAMEENCTLPDHNNDGFAVQIEARQVQGKGRGVFAKEDIKRGQLVYSSTQTARFDNGPVYRKFLLSLEVGFACDVLQWAYVQNLNDSDDNSSKEGEDLWITVDLDEGSFINDGSWDDDDITGAPNIGLDDAYEEVVDNIESNYFALRDVKAGEEVTCSYGDFVVSDGWIYFDLMR